MPRYALPPYRGNVGPAGRVVFDPPSRDRPARRWHIALISNANFEGAELARGLLRSRQVTMSA